MRKNRRKKVKATYLRGVSNKDNKKILEIESRIK